MSMAPQQWRGRSTNGWPTWIGLSLALIVVPAAPIVALLGWLLSWGGTIVTVAVVVTVLVWGLLATAWVLVKRDDAHAATTVDDEISALPNLARTHGLHYAALSPGLAETLKSADEFVRASRATQVISGSVGGRPTAITWWERRIVHVGMTGLHLVIALPASVPKIRAAPVLANEFAPGLHRERIRFEDADFNGRYDVISYDHSPAAARYAADMFSQRAIGWLLTVEPFAFEIDGALLHCDGSDTLRVSGYAEMLERATVLAHLLDSIPAFVWSRYGRPAAAPAGLAL